MRVCLCGYPHDTSTPERQNRKVLPPKRVRPIFNTNSVVVWLTEKSFPSVQPRSLVGLVSLHRTAPQHVLEDSPCPARIDVVVSRGVIEQANNALEEHMLREHPELAKRFVIPDLMKEVWKERVRKALMSMFTRYYNYSLPRSLRVQVVRGASSSPSRLTLNQISPFFFKVEAW